MVDADTIDVGDVLKLPGGDCSADVPSSGSGAGRDAALIVVGLVGALLVSLFAYSQSRGAGHEQVGGGATYKV